MITYSSQKAINQPHDDTLEYPNMARICDMLRIHAKSLNYIYADETTILQNCRYESTTTSILENQKYRLRNVQTSLTED